MKYIIDSNSFIAPHRGYSPIDVAKSLWNSINQMAINGEIYTLDKVKDELFVNDDELKTWMIDNMPSSFFLKFDNEQSNYRLREISNWANQNPHYTQRAKDKFLKMDKADIFLVAYASLDPDEWSIVSMERSAPLRTAEIKLPDVCQYYNVKCLMLHEMFREMGVTY